MACRIYDFHELKDKNSISGTSAIAPDRNQQTADAKADSCCRDGDGITFPKTGGDVLGTWDGKHGVCIYSGPVTTQNTVSLFRNLFPVDNRLLILIA